MDWNWNYQWGAPKSWICSSCGRSFAPHVSECPYCNNREVKRTTTTTGTSIDDSKWWEEYLKKSQTGTPVEDEPSSAIKMGQNLAELLSNAIGGLFND